MLVRLSFTSLALVHAKVISLRATSLKYVKLLSHKDDQLCFPKLTYKQRLTGFLTCLTIGFTLELFVWITLARLLKGKPAPLANFYNSRQHRSFAANLFPSRLQATMQEHVR